MPSNKTKGRVFELGDHRAVVRKDTKRKSPDLDRTSANRIVMHEEDS
jgi:hypothetical protein